MSSGGGDAKLFARVRQQSIMPYRRDCFLFFDMLPYNAIVVDISTL